MGFKCGIVGLPNVGKSTLFNALTETAAAQAANYPFCTIGLLTSMPVLYVCNVDEASAAAGNDFSRQVERRAQAEGAGCVVISAKIEAEIAVLSRAERAEYLAAVGLEEP